jgi:alkaline phosphatase D
VNRRWSAPNGRGCPHGLQSGDVTTSSATIWARADRPAAHYFDPAKASYPDFTPFWQFTSDPLNAGAFPPDTVDTTFGAQQVFVKAPDVPNASPATEFQFFGQVHISSRSKEMTVRLRDNSGRALFSKVLSPST